MTDTTTDPTGARPSHLDGRVVLITGAGGGFGRLVATKAGARGARIVAVDIDADAAATTADLVVEAGGAAVSAAADVTSLADMQAAVALAVDTYGAVDVLINNAGIMPLAFYADHARAMDAWDRCIDVNIKGVLHGIVAAHDQMIAQGRGHVVNLSSIYGNHPVAGAAVYGATKTAVNVLSESLRQESQGRIKVTTVRPTGVPGTNLGSGVVNPEAIGGILGSRTAETFERFGAIATGQAPVELTDVDSIGYFALDPDLLADQIVYAIDQPWGVTISDITVRAAGDPYVI